MNILIVDDELYARKALAKRIERIVTSKVAEIYEAEDVATAKQLLSCVGFDLVFSDIRMPGESGLDLVAYLLSNQFIGRTFIVSGHAEFEYAQRAMALGVKQYLLKPVAQEQLQEILDEALQAEVGSNQRNTEQSLDRLVQGDTDLPLPFAAKAYRMLLMQKETQWELAEHTCVRACLAKHQLMGASAIYSLNHKRLIVLCEEAVSCDAFLEDITAQLHCVAGVSAPFQEKEDIVQAFAFARAALGEHIVNAFQRVFYYRMPETTLFTEAELLLFTQYLESDVEKACQYKEKLFERIAVARREYAQLEVLYHRLVVDLQAYAFSKNNHADFISFAPLTDFESLYHLNDYLDEIIQRIRTAQQLPVTGTMADVVAFLQENYFDFISMESLAREKYFMNPKYFSKLFKEYTGKTFSKYLTQIRMENAQKYLQESTYTVSQVAVMCGYNSVSNFIKTFKTYYGETPTQHELML